MAVTDMTDSLPWWARQGGGGPNPMTMPPGAGQDWLRYLMAMQGQSPDVPSADAQPMSVNVLTDDGGHGTGDNPPVTPFPVPRGNPGPMTGPAGPVSNLPPPPSIASLQQPTPNPYAGPQPGLSAPNYTNPFLAAGAGPGAGLDAPAVIRSPRGATATPGAGPLPNVPAPAARPVSGPLAASPGAARAAPAGNDRFSTFRYENPNSSASRAPIYTALNLAGLFGGGQPAAAANPANLPSRAAQPVNGPLASGAMSKAPWSWGPLQKGMVWPKDMGPKRPRSSSGYGDPRLWG